MNDSLIFVKVGGGGGVKHTFKKHEARSRYVMSLELSILYNLFPYKSRDAKTFFTLYFKCSCFTVRYGTNPVINSLVDYCSNSW